MNILHTDVEKYINTSGSLDPSIILDELSEIYSITNNSEKYVLHQLVKRYIQKIEQEEITYEKRRDQLKKLKELKLPEQRSAEWYEMRKDKLTASSMADALNKGHFQSRDELLLSKIEEKPFEPNPITEWGVKYEDVAIKFYEELYNVKVLEFGLIPHPEFDAFGASPDGICEDTGNKK